MKYDIIIIGGGPAGLSSGIYASRLGAKTLILRKIKSRRSDNTKQRNRKLSRSL